MQKIEKVFIIQPIFNPNWRVLHDEAVSLIESAGGAYCGSSYQNIKEINPATFIGSGKLQEIKATLEGLDEITVLFNGELSPSQTLNISAALDDRKVIDRTTLILDIFALNAVTSEGKVQVELAQLKYIYPRLKGKGAAPPRTAQRTARKRRCKNYCARRLYKYGKIQPDERANGGGRTRKKRPVCHPRPHGDGVNFILIDTVGFIQQLPHDIVEAFKSTLDSAVNCDLALFVADAAGDFTMQFETTLSTLTSLGFDKPYLKILNKCDLIDDTENLPSDCICISAKKNIGLDELKRRIALSFSDTFTHVKFLVPYDKMSEYASLGYAVNERARTFTDEGLEIDCAVENKYLSKIQKFIKM